MFINYCPDNGLTINSYRRPDAIIGCIADVAIAVTEGIDQVCCQLGGAKAALEDGSLWNGLSVSQEVLEEIHALICENAG